MTTQWQKAFFQLLKRERIKRRIYKYREEAKADIFDYVEMLYNDKRRHSACEDQLPAVYESAWFMRHGTVQEIEVYSDLLVEVAKISIYSTRPHWPRLMIDMSVDCK